MFGADDDFDDFFQSGDADPDSAHAAVTIRTERDTPPRLGVLAELSDAEFDTVARAAKLSHVLAGTELVRQGEEADRFFILIDGAVEVSRDDRSVATLAPGAFFGESALLVQGRRTATVTALADSSVWSVSYAAFDAAMSHHLLADEDRRAEAHRRIASASDSALREALDRNAQS